MKKLVSIAYNNGSRWAGDLIKSLGSEPYISIVDTGSSAEEKKKLQRLESRRVNVSFVDRGYVPSAYKKSFELFPDFDEYFCMHDAMICKKRDFWSDFRARGEVTAWIAVTMDRPSQFCEYNLSTYPDLDSMPPVYIFGPIFYASKTAMSRLVFPAPCKSHSELEVSERAFAIGFHRAGFEINYIDWFDDNRIDNLKNYEHFNKMRLHRP